MLLHLYGTEIKRIHADTRIVLSQETKKVHCNYLSHYKIKNPTDVIK